MKKITMKDVVGDMNKVLKEVKTFFVQVQGEFGKYDEKLIMLDKRIKSLEDREAKRSRRRLY